MEACETTVLSACVSVHLSAYLPQIAEAYEIIFLSLSIRYPTCFFFAMRSVLCQRKVRYRFVPELLVYLSVCLYVLPLIFEAYETALLSVCLYSRYRC
jgi:hypothetical protein